jgi:hypothetical protein
LSSPSRKDFSRPSQWSCLGLTANEGGGGHGRQPSRRCRQPPNQNWECGLDDGDPACCYLHGHHHHHNAQQSALPCAIALTCCPIPSGQSEDGVHSHRKSDSFAGRPRLLRHRRIVIVAKGNASTDRGREPCRRRCRLGIIGQVLRRLRGGKGCQGYRPVG